LGIPIWGSFSKGSQDLFNGGEFKKTRGVCSRCPNSQKWFPEGGKSSPQKYISGAKPSGGGLIGGRGRPTKRGVLKTGGGYTTKKHRGVDQEKNPFSSFGGVGKTPPHKREVWVLPPKNPRGVVFL